jgi:hypothetical protein
VGVHLDAIPLLHRPHDPPDRRHAFLGVRGHRPAPPAATTEKSLPLKQNNEGRTD